MNEQLHKIFAETKITSPAGVTRLEVDEIKVKEYPHDTLNGRFFEALCRRASPDLRAAAVFPCHPQFPQQKKITSANQSNAWDASLGEK